MFSSWLQCSEGCAGRHDALSVLYRCPKCSALLEVAHDVEAIRTVPAAEWRARFEARWAPAAPPPFGSGVWTHHEWVMPGVASQDVVSLIEGKTPLLSSPRLAEAIGVSALSVKQCGTSHTGSFKDLGMTVLVSAVNAMRRRGLPIRAVACASTGDTSAALAAYGAAAGIPTLVFLPKGKISPAQLVQPISSGALVLQLETDFDGCMALVKKVCEAKDSPIYLANSMNPLRIEGQKTVAFEIAAQLGWEVPDWVVIPGGNLGNASALGAGFELLLAAGLTSRRPRIAVAQAEAANPLYRSFKTRFAERAPVVAQDTEASAIRIGNPVSMGRAIRALERAQGVVEQASERELAEAAARADRFGLFVDPHTAVALAALEKLVREGVIAPSSRVVVVSTAHALKFGEFKARYHAGETGAWRNAPISLPATEDAVLGALREWAS